MLSILRKEHEEKDEMLSILRKELDAKNQELKTQSDLIALLRSADERADQRLNALHDRVGLLEDECGQIEEVMGEIEDVRGDLNDLTNEVAADKLHVNEQLDNLDAGLGSVKDKLENYKEDVDNMVDEAIDNRFEEHVPGLVEESVDDRIGGRGVHTPDIQISNLLYSIKY